MSDNTPHTRHDEDAHADGAPPTDAVSDDVKEAAAAAGDEVGADDEDLKDR